jgi:two-component system, OmpR family, sensor kinase
MRLLPRSIRLRLVLLFAAGSLVTVLLSLSLLYVALQGQLSAALDADLQHRSDDVLAALRNGDRSAVFVDPMAQVYSGNGSVVFSSTGLGGRLLDDAQIAAVGEPARSSRMLPLGYRGEEVRVRLLSRRVGASGDVLTVGLPSGAVEQARGRQLAVLAVAVPLLVALLAALGWLLVRAALRPVDVLTREAAAISTLEAGRRLPAAPGDDEISRLARTLDGMLARLSVAFARERAFVDDASHELRTPIAVLGGEIELALGALDDPLDGPAEVRQSLLAAQGQVGRLTRLAQDLLLLARERDGSLLVHREPVDLLDLVREEATVLGPAVGMRITAEGAPAVVEADADRLRQVLANLAANSAAAGAGEARITIEVDREWTGLRWADDGPGFDPELLGSAFERFVRGDESRASASGAGLGLSIVRAVLTAHGGTAALRNGPPLGGGVVILHLPVT